jgi:hypothetical protein
MSFAHTSVRVAQIAKCFKVAFTRKLMVAVKTVFGKAARNAQAEKEAIGLPQPADVPAPAQRISPEQAEGEEDGGRPNRSSQKVRGASMKTARTV